MLQGWDLCVLGVKFNSSERGHVAYQIAGDNE